MVHGKNFFDQQVKNDLKTYNNIRKIATGQVNDYTTVCLLDYLYFEKYYKLNAIDLSKQQKLDAVPRAIQQINFTGNLKKGGNTAIFFTIEEPLSVYFALIQYQDKITRYNTLNVKLPTSQLNMLKSGMKNGTFKSKFKSR